jgi:hypothetical protein
MASLFNQSLIDNQLYYTNSWEVSFGSFWVHLKQVQMPTNPYSVSVNISNEN